MATNTAFLRTDDQYRPTITKSFVVDYKDAHNEMLSAIGAMDDLTREMSPNPLRLSHTRLRITRSSFECRTIFRKIAANLSRNSTPTVAQTIANLEKHHSELFVVTSAHLANWTPQQVQSDWVGYCRSSADVRSRWREMIEHERRQLYPLLDLRAGAQAKAGAFRSN